MSVYQRVDAFLKTKKKYKKDAAIDVDVSRETVLNWFRKPKTMPIFFLEWIKETYPELNLEWLFTGEGEMELKEKSELESRVEELELIIKQTHKETFQSNQQIAKLIGLMEKAGIEAEKDG